MRFKGKQTAILFVLCVDRAQFFSPHSALEWKKFLCSEFIEQGVRRTFSVRRGAWPFEEIFLKGRISFVTNRSMR